MASLNELQFLVRAGRAASLSDAARAMDISPAAASALVKRLEAELGLRLFVRSTRSLRPTAEGQAFLQRCEQGLEIIENARESLLAGRDVIRGTLQLSLPSDLGRNVVLKWLHEFGRRYPEVRFRLQFSDRLAEVPLCEAWRGESAPLYLACADRSQASHSGTRPPRRRSSATSRRDL